MTLAKPNPLHLIIRIGSRCSGSPARECSGGHGGSWRSRGRLPREGPDTQDSGCCPGTNQCGEVSAVLIITPLSESQCWPEPRGNGAREAMGTAFASSRGSLMMDLEVSEPGHRSKQAARSGVRGKWWHRMAAERPMPEYMSETSLGDSVGEVRHLRVSDR